MTNSINSLQSNLWKWLLVSFGSIVIIYGILRIVPIMRGVAIHTFVPEDEEIALDSFMLTGNARHARTLSINGRNILIEPSGEFEDEVILSPGINKIKITAEDVRGKTHSKELVLIGKERLKEIKTAQISEIEKTQEELIITN